MPVQIIRRSVPNVAIAKEQPVCPGCNLHRPKSEFETGPFEFQYCIICRGRKPAYKSIYVRKAEM